jgi:ABC-type proline/glycine betaine transport system permease subunit
MSLFVNTVTIPWGRTSDMVTFLKDSQTYPSYVYMVPLLNISNVGKP